MIPQTSQARLSVIGAEVVAHVPRPPLDLGKLDFLGRMPIPLRRPFKTGLDRTVAGHLEGGGEALSCCFLSGGEWYRPFDGLARAPSEGLPSMLVSPLYHDIVSPDLLSHYASARGARAPTACHPACRDAGLPDPLGTFRLFAVILFVFLVDETRLRGRTAPRVWSDLFDPVWRDDIVFGGWRPNDRVPYQDYNSYLLLSLHREFGGAGLEALAANIRHLQHNVRTAALAGSNSRDVGAIAILPWLQAELCPRRARTRVVWPEDGALVMPIGYMVKPDAETRLAPLIDYVEGSALGRVLARNCYPPARPGVNGAFPPDARLKWVGWDYVRAHDFAAETRRAAQVFFSAWQARDGVMACG